MRVRTVVRTLSEICLTLGTVIVLFVVYVLYWTGVRADAAMDREIDRLQDRWSTGALTGTDPGAGTDTGTGPDADADGGSGSGADADGADPGPGSRARPGRPGESFAIMYIPRFGRDWAKPVLEGTAAGTLKKGLGHYTGTAAPGARGNFAVAGHRRTYGDPFKDVPRLRPGDAVVLTDGTTWYTYRVDAKPYRTLPSDTGVIAPVPERSGYRRPGRYLTLTTCDPEWGHSHRLIVWAHLERTSPAALGKPDTLPG
ncbi:class E sortase [Streptomyces sp. XD-27]|uniref:class E sortase n=1 Tax=Streptomyces sp. XD-27 TaxID=3062779 RepID=UPI0026F44FC9|nr:class E sortase [Streptomyces sp. XD-27]WKX71475.1 class E sortase [Streptomyces sp. XD-27]